MGIEDSLQKCSKDDLAALISRLYGVNGDTDVLIDAWMARLSDDKGSGTGELERFKRHLDEVVFDNDFIGYRQAGPFAARVGMLLESGCNDLAEQDPRDALALVEHFLGMVDQVFEQADDSGGDIGDLFRNAVQFWLQIAADVRNSGLDDGIDWSDKVLHYFERNDYGCFDDIIADSDVLLEEEELQLLARRFENDVRKALKAPAKPESFNYEALHACLGLESVARALEDMALFEKSTLLRSPEPNALQMRSIVEFATEIHDYERARYWLDRPGWDGQRAEQSRLTSRLLKVQGDIEGLKDNLLCDFFERPSGFTLEAYWDLADAGEKSELIPKVEALVQQARRLDDAVEMLRVIEQLPLAAERLIERAGELSDLHYTRLTEWVRDFERAGLQLASILCYRALLGDILDRGYTKAYHYAADYFHKLLELDRQGPDYRRFGNAQQFIRQLQQAHWRKRSFWSEANYPNKAR